MLRDVPAIEVNIITMGKVNNILNNQVKNYIKENGIEALEKLISSKEDNI